MTEQEALQKMVAPGTPRKGKWRNGVIQVWVTRACDNACFGCTQGSNLGGKPGVITVEQFEIAVKSLKGYFGVVGMFGGNPAVHPHFEELCEVMVRHVPRQQRGIWCNNPMTVEKAKVMRKTFNPLYSNLNVHLNREAFRMFREGWPECRPVGLEGDSRHSPVHLSMSDVIPDEGKRWELIADCDINKHWSAMVGVFRGEVRAWFCEVAGAQAMLFQDDRDYPDTGVKIEDHDGKIVCGESVVVRGHRGRPVMWWEFHMGAFAEQVRQHCHNCGVPLRGYGELAMAEGGTEQTSKYYEKVFAPKRRDRNVELVERLEQLGTGRITKTVSYLENAKV